MAIVTGLEVQKKDDTRVNLYLDGNFFVGISMELVLLHQIKKGMEVDEQFLLNLVFEDEKEKAMGRAVKYLGGTLKTTKQLRDYLKKKEYSEQTIDYVIDKMKEYKYLDDVAYAKSFIATFSSKYGRTKLTYALRSKGVSDSIIDSVFEDDETVIENSLNRVAEKYLKNKPRCSETYQKLSRFLYGRGYQFDEINSYINSLKSGE